MSTDKKKILANDIVEFSPTIQDFVNIVSWGAFSIPDFWEHYSAKEMLKEGGVKGINEKEFVQKVDEQIAKSKKELEKLTRLVQTINNASERSIHKLASIIIKPPETPPNPEQIPFRPLNFGSGYPVLHRPFYWNYRSLF